MFSGFLLGELRFNRLIFVLGPVFINPYGSFEEADVVLAGLLAPKSEVDAVLAVLVDPCKRGDIVSVDPFDPCRRCLQAQRTLIVNTPSLKGKNLNVFFLTLSPPPLISVTFSLSFILR